MIIVGERINSSRKQIMEAIRAHDAGFIRKEAELQAEAGASYIDVNAGMFAQDEERLLRWLISEVQAVTSLPLSIDSANPDVIRAVIGLTGSAPLINSLTLEPASLEGLLSLVVERGARVIGLCQGTEGLAETCEQKLKMADRLVTLLTGAGVALADIFVDPLAYSIGTNDRSGVETLEAIGRIVGEFPGVHIICGLTNVSYGLPERRLINRTFLAAAISRGLDAAILDPTDRELMKSVHAAELVAGRDPYAANYIRAYRARLLE